MSADILVVDDEDDIRELVCGILNDEGYTPRTAHDSCSALSQIKERRPSLIILDIWLQGSQLDGLELLQQITKAHADIPVIMISGHGNIETAVSAIRMGAVDYIEKPFKTEKLLLTISHALDRLRMNREINYLRRRIGQIDRLVGISPAIEKINLAIQKMGASNSRVLLAGPRGSGREIAARLIHAHSGRAMQMFLVLSTSLYDEHRLTAVLFGEEIDGRVETGVLEQAHGGTLYIDEIDQWPLDLQQKFLKFLTENKFRRLNGEGDVQVDVRVLASTSQQPTKLMQEGKLLQDLYHRIGVVQLLLPSLKERREDIPVLIASFITVLSDQLNMKPRPVEDDVMAILQAHNWSGNVRQLRNCIEQMMISANDHNRAALSLDDLPGDVLSEKNMSVVSASSSRIVSLPLREARELFEREYLLTQIERFGGNISRTASFVGMERSALHRKLKSLDIQTSEKIDKLDQNSGDTSADNRAKGLSTVGGAPSELNSDLSKEDVDA